MGSPKKFEAPQYPYLVKAEEGSMRNLTLDEFIIGKPMMNNLEELVHNVISTEDNQIMQQNPPSSSASSSSSSSSPPLFNGNLTTLSKKAIDDLLNDFKSPLPRATETSSAAEEFTLEEFLIRNGAMSTMGNYQDHHQGFVQNINPGRLMTKIHHDHSSNLFSKWQQEVLMPMPVQAIVGSNFRVPDTGFESKMMDLGYLNNKQIKIAQEMETAAKYSDSQGETATSTTRVCTDEVMAKTIERRQRRMIKNRESAARSRARKQAYTNQLQHNVVQLQTTNNWLRKRKEREALLDSNSPSTPRYQLRRTSSAEL